MSDLAVPDKGVYGVLEWQDYNGASVRRGATYAEMFDAVETVVKASDRLQFTLGDMLVYAHDTFGHRYPQFVADLSRSVSRSESTLLVWEWTARNVRYENRRVGVAWMKHSLLSTLKDDVQVAWLDRIEREHLTTREIKELLVVEGLRKPPPALTWTGVEECFRCGRMVKVGERRDDC